MKIFPRILALYAGDYQRQRYGQMIIWILLVTTILFAAIVYVVQIDFQEVFIEKGQVVNSEDQQYVIAFDIPASWATRVRAGNLVIFIDNANNTIDTLITQVEQKNVSDTIQLFGRIKCKSCQLVPSQWVELHIVTRKSSILDMFKHTFTKE